MARMIFIGGRSGTGKTTSFRNLNPKETVIINADKKELPIPKFGEKYNDNNKNYKETSDLGVIRTILKYASDNLEIKRVIIDTWSRTMDDEVMSEMFRKAPNPMKAWGEMAAQQYDLFSLIKSLRPDLKVYLMAHTETFYNDQGLLAEKIVTQGKMLDKFVPESFSTIVLYTDVRNIPGQGVEFYFRTKTNGPDTCKTPMGMFEEAMIPNDLVEIEEKINKYYE